MAQENPENRLRNLDPETLGHLDTKAVEIYEAVVVGGFLPRRIPTASASIDVHVSVDLAGFFELVYNTVIDWQDRCGVITADRVTFSEQAPPQDLKTETITYKLLKRVPGAQTGSVPDIVGDRSVKREWRPRARYTKTTPDKPLKRVTVMGQSFDNVIEFTCWAATNKVVNQRAEWFEKYMDTYHWYFKYMGVKECIYLGRSEDKYWEDNKTQGNLLKSRSMQYYVKTDRTYEVSEAVIRDILINVAAGTG
jgi:hypothetical protein